MGGTEFLLIFFAILFGIAILLIPVIFFFITLQKTLAEVSDENRKMPSGQVWLAFIPVFGLAWNFIMVNAIADSLKAEFDQRGIPHEEARPGSAIGIAMSVCNCCGVIPILGYLASIGALVLWIIYWVKISGYKRLLIAAKNGN